MTWAELCLTVLGTFMPCWRQRRSLRSIAESDVVSMPPSPVVMSGYPLTVHVRPRCCCLVWTARKQGSYCAVSLSETSVIDKIERQPSHKRRCRC